MSNYRDVIIETYQSTSRGSRSLTRARPAGGQGLDTAMNVECSSKMRKAHPAGTRFLVQAKLTSRDGGTPFLYVHYNAPYRVLDDTEADELIAIRAD